MQSELAHSSSHLKEAAALGCQSNTRLLVNEIMQLGRKVLTWVSRPAEAVVMALTGRKGWPMYLGFRVNKP